MGRVVGLDELVEIRKSLASHSKKVVFTNGCFDLIHRGHVDYLVRSRALGDVLIVGLNTDASVRRIKGDKRPIIEEADRAFIVANLHPVDYVCLFDDETPLRLISAIVPDVLIKGADWNVNDIVGKDIVEAAGGRVATVELVENRSTTALIERIVERFSGH